MARSSDPHAARQAAAAVVERLRTAGHIAYFAGGCVRDALLGLHPTDYDVATDATPPRVRAIFQRTQEVGAAFGVVLVTVAPDNRRGLPTSLSEPAPTDQRVTVEVATFRADGPYTDARRPDSVVFSDPQSDAARRDFTVNALFIDPPRTGLTATGDNLVSDADGVPLGNVIDYVGGIADLKGRVLRAVGDPDRRLAEDHLRALRAVRFASRLGFAIDPATRDAIKRHAAALRGVSRERIGDELRRMLAHPTRAAAVRLLQSLQLDGPVLEDRHLDAPTVLLEAVQAPCPTPGGELGFPLAAWLVDRFRAHHPDELWPAPAAADQTVKRARSALCLSNDESHATRQILHICNAISQTWKTLGVASRKRLAHMDLFPAAMVIVAATDAVFGRGVETEVQALALDGIGLGPEPLVSGDDLVAAGHTPSPRFKRVLDQVYDAQLEGHIRDKNGGLELARQLGV